MLLRFTQYGANVFVPLDRLLTIIEFRPDDSKTPIRTHLVIGGDTYAGVDQNWELVLKGRALAREIQRYELALYRDTYLDCSSEKTLKIAENEFRSFTNQPAITV